VIIELEISTTITGQKSSGNSDENSKKLISRLKFVDLAGSEKINFETKSIMKEGSNINKSLLSLTNCFNILSERSQNGPNAQNSTFIPYRNSKLTRLLKDSLNGSTPLILLVCLSPNNVYLEETINSINYAIKAGNIKKQNLGKKADKFWSKNRLGINKKASEKKKMRLTPLEEYSKRIEELELENKILKTKRNHNSLLSKRSKITLDSNFDKKLLGNGGAKVGNEIFVTLGESSIDPGSHQ
jgi:hypothetical protein